MLVRNTSINESPEAEPAEREPLEPALSYPQARIAEIEEEMGVRVKSWKEDELPYPDEGMDSLSADSHPGFLGVRGSEAGLRMLVRIIEALLQGEEHFNMLEAQSPQTGALIRVEKVKPKRTAPRERRVREV